MKTIVHEIPYSPASNLDEEIFTASSVFFDIETTGFSPAHTSLYLIGCAYHIEQMLYIKQFFAETPEEEKEVLEQFLLLSDGFDTIITFKMCIRDRPIAINNNVCICHIPPIHFFPLHLQLSSLFRCRLQTCCIRHSLH